MSIILFISNTFPKFIFHRILGVAAKEDFDMLSTWDSSRPTISIPAVGTIQDWHANADLNCNPGIMKYSLQLLKRKVDEMAANGEELIGALLFDEVAIYKLFNSLVMR